LFQTIDFFVSRKSPQACAGQITFASKLVRSLGIG